MKDNARELAFSDYFLVPLRHRAIVLITLAGMIALALWHNSRQVPIYQATATLLIDRESVRSPLTGQRMEYETYLSESLTFNSHYKLITSQRVLEKVVQRLGLDQRPAGQTPDRSVKGTVKQFVARIRNNINLVLNHSAQQQDPVSPPERDPVIAAAQSLKSVIDVKPVENTRLLTLTVTQTDSVMAQTIANTVTAAYIQFNIDNRLQASQNTLSWLTRSLSGMKENLEDSETKFLAYKESMNVISLEKDEQMTAQKIQELNASLMEAANRSYELEARLNQLRSLRGNGSGVTNPRFLASNPILESLHRELIEEEMALSNVQGIYQFKHPRYVEIETRIVDIKGKIKEQIATEVENLDTELTVQRNKEEILKKSIADLEAEAMAAGRNQVGYNILKRNMDMNQEVYDSILSRIKEGALTENINVSNIRVVEDAVLPTGPVGPNNSRNLMMAVIVGLILGVGGSFAREYMDRSIRSEEDVERYLDIPVLSVIPKI